MVSALMVPIMRPGNQDVIDLNAQKSTSPSTDSGIQGKLKIMFTIGFLNTISQKIMINNFKQKNAGSSLELLKMGLKLNSYHGILNIEEKM